MKYLEAVLIETKRILLTLEERDKWIKRREVLVAKLKDLPRKERKLHREEMARIDKEITYYDGLVREMKTEMKPNKVNSLLNTLMKF